MNKYPNPFIPERADPYAMRAPDGTCYFTASYPAFGDAEHGYDRIVLRKSNTVAGLATAEEKTIWKAPSSGICSRHIWAPELHLIGGKWYVYFAAGNSDDVWHIRPYVLRCKGDDPFNDEWCPPVRMEAMESDEQSFRSFSLDMTYLEHKGRHFVIWAEIIGASSLFIAEIDPSEPWKLTSHPILLTKPEYDWEKVRFHVNEGAAVLKTEDKIYVFFSASGTGSEYCIGRLSADADAYLMNPASWYKLPYPVLSTEDLVGESGPGHNSFIADENGDILLVYHARPASHLEGKCGTFTDDPLYDPCRHARIRKVSFDETGVPNLK